MCGVRQKKHVIVSRASDIQRLEEAQRTSPPESLQHLGLPSSQIPSSKEIQTGSTSQLGVSQQPPTGQPSTQAGKGVLVGAPIPASLSTVNPGSSANPPKPPHGVLANGQKKPAYEKADGSFHSEKDERTLLLEEILASERTYVDSLCILVTHFFQPIERDVREGSTIIEDKRLQSIFANVSQLMSLNVELLRVMEMELKSAEKKRRQTNPSATEAGEDDLAQAITKAFKEIIPYFKMYSWYVNNYPTAIEVLKSEQTSNKKFAKYLADQQSHEICRGLDLGAYLIMPVQRLCKYPLLFGRLLKETPEDNDDYENIKQVNEVVNAITDLVDLDRDRAEKSLRGFEIANFLSLEALSKRLNRDLHVLEPGRVFKAEWTSLIARSMSRRSTSEPQKPRTMFLFSDSLILAKKGSKGYEARVWMSLDSVILGDLAPFDPEVNSPAGEDQDSSEPSSPMNAIRAGLTWTPKLIGSKRVITAPPTTKEALSQGPLNRRYCTFSIICRSSMALSRLSLSRHRSKSEVETFAFFFESDAQRRSVHAELANAIREYQVGRPRPQSSQSVIMLAGTSSASFHQSRRPMSEGYDAEQRKARSLSPPPLRIAASLRNGPATPYEEADPFHTAFTTEEDEGENDSALGDTESVDSQISGAPVSRPSRAPQTSPLVIGKAMASRGQSTLSSPSSSTRKLAKRPPAPVRPPAPQPSGSLQVGKSIPSPRASDNGGRKRVGGSSRPAAPGRGGSLGSLPTMSRPVAPTKSNKQSGTQNGRKPRPIAPTKAQAKSKQEYTNPASGDLRAISSPDWSSTHGDDVDFRTATPEFQETDSRSRTNDSAVSIRSTKPVHIVQRPPALALCPSNTSVPGSDMQAKLVDKWFGDDSESDASSGDSTPNGM